MRSSWLITRRLLSAAVGAALLLAPIAAPGAIDKCQKAYQKESLKLFNAIEKALAKCKDKIRADTVKGSDLSKTANFCEKQLSKVYGLEAGADLTKTRIGKFQSGIKKKFDNATCTQEDLETMGHLVSGVNAPGASIEDWSIAWLIKAKEMLAIKEDFFVVGDSRDLLDSVIGLEADTVNCDPSAGVGCGTDCSGTPPAGTFYRPNLCSFDTQMQPSCRTHACALDAFSGASVLPASAPAPLPDGTLALEICKFPGPGTPFDVLTGINSDDFIGIINQPSRVFVPAPVIPLPPPVTACIDIVRSEGWCDCGTNSIPYEPSTCIDHDSDPGPVDSCGGDTDDATSEADDGCFCAAPAAATCDPAVCSVCARQRKGDRAVGASRCHPGTSNGEEVRTYAGASGPGACLVRVAISIRLATDFLCVDGASNFLGQQDCVVAGLPPGGCSGVGGIACLDAAGGDGVFCTMDDLAPAAPPVTVSFTTGTADGVITDMPFVEGICNLGGNMNCTSGADCFDAFGTDFGPCIGLILGDYATPLVAGSGIPCDVMESSNLSGLSFAGAVPSLDTPYQDLVTTFKLNCE